MVAMDAAAERKPRRDEFIDLPVVATDSSASSSFAAHRAIVEGRDTEARRSARVAAGRKPVLVAGATPAMCATAAMSATCTGRCECAGEEPGLVVMDATLGGRSSSALSHSGPRSSDMSAFPDVSAATDHKCW